MCRHKIERKGDTYHLAGPLSYRRESGWIMCHECDYRVNIHPEVVWDDAPPIKFDSVARQRPTANIADALGLPE